MERPVGIFDSGIGGLTVLLALKEHLGSEKYIYFGDTARVPYGNKGKRTVTRYSIEIANFLLMRYDIKALVMACNTASSIAFESLKKLYRIPVFDVVTPAVQRAASMTNNGKVGVIGTSSTIRSNSYRKKLKAIDGELRVYQRACPLFVPLVEEGWIDHPVTSEIVREYLSPLKRKGVDTLILGCTHYPFLKRSIGAYMGDGVAVIDSATSVALDVKRSFDSKGISSSQSSKKSVYLVTDDPVKFREHGKKLLGKFPQAVHEVAL